MTFQFPTLGEKILPHDIKIVRPPADSQAVGVLNRIKGSLTGLAVGDALGASVEFRPNEYLKNHPVTDMAPGGTWGLSAGQWTDDTSMALCLASSLITQRDFNPYDQLVRYKWWYQHGYLSSTGQCFDIGHSTCNALEEFRRRQTALVKDHGYKTEQELDQLDFESIKRIKFDVDCGDPESAGNGALMRLAPVPLFFYKVPHLAVRLSGKSARLTHGHVAAIDACRYYGALIVAALNGESKENLLDANFLADHEVWFSSSSLHKEVLDVALGSFKRKNGYKDGIRGKGHVIYALEAALWAFWATDTFEEGALKAVNLGDDTDTTAAIYGQLAGAFYGYEGIPRKWRETVYAGTLITCIAEWIQYLSYSDSSKSDNKRPMYIEPPLPPQETQTQSQGSSKTKPQQKRVTLNKQRQRRSLADRLCACVGRSRAIS